MQLKQTFVCWDVLPLQLMKWSCAIAYCGQEAGNVFSSITHVGLPSTHAEGEWCFKNTIKPNFTVNSLAIYYFNGPVSPLNVHLNKLGGVCEVARLPRENKPTVSARWPVRLWLSLCCRLCAYLTSQVRWARWVPWCNGSNHTPGHRVTGSRPVLHVSMRHSLLSQ